MLRLKIFVSLRGLQTSFPSDFASAGTWAQLWKRLQPQVERSKFSRHHWFSFLRTSLLSLLAAACFTCRICRKDLQQVLRMKRSWRDGCDVAVRCKKLMNLPDRDPNSFPNSVVPFETVQVVRAAGEILQAAEQIFAEVPRWPSRWVELLWVCTVNTWNFLLNQPGVSPPPTNLHCEWSLMAVRHVGTHGAVRPAWRSQILWRWAPCTLMREVSMSSSRHSL